MGSNRKAGLPVDLLSGVYRPGFEPDISNIIDDRVDFEEVIEEVETKVETKIEDAQKAVREGPQKPLTELEAMEVDRKIESLQGEISATRDRIKNFKTFIDQQAVGADGNEVQFTLDLNGKPELRRAVIQLFGAPYPQITYSMYLEAKKMRRQLEKSEAKNYVAGNW